MRCKDCYHFLACSYWNRYLKEEATAYRNCPDFMDKNQVIVLPMKANETLRSELSNHCFRRCVDEL